MSLSWQLQAQKAKNILDNSIPKQWLAPEDKLPPADQKNVLDFARQSGLLTDRELSITELSATAIVLGIKAGEFTAEDVVVAFLKRAVLGHQLLNFATEFMTERAIARAKELDAHFQRTGELVGPLHGIPISVKEHVGVKGLTHNGGFVAWVNQTATEDALLLQCLERAGAVFHVRTNQPQSLMKHDPGLISKHLCCENNLTGKTLNPHNRTLTPGGSSGGEGASSSFRCSPLGIGTDIGGSIRAPAAFCGTYGYRPTNLRNPCMGLTAAAGGQESIRGAIGPMSSSSIEDLEVFQRAVLDQEPWDVEISLVPLPWKSVEPSSVKHMTVGIMWDDGWVRPHPPITRALQHAKEKLLAAGIKVVDWEPYKHTHGWEIVSALYFPDGTETTKAVLHQSGEPILPLTSWAFSFSQPTPLTICQNWALNFARDIYRNEYHALMKARGVDFLLTPTYPGVAAVYGESQYWNYTAIWNILDQPGVVFPSGLFVDSELDKVDGEYVPRDEVDAREWNKYQPERYEGAPVGLQLVGKHFRDEQTLAMGRVVEAALRGVKV